MTFDPKIGRFQSLIGPAKQAELPGVPASDALAQGADVDEANEQMEALLFNFAKDSQDRFVQSKPAEIKEPPKRFSTSGLFRKN